MPKIEVIFNDLQYLVGDKLPREIEELNEILSYVKSEAIFLGEEILSVEIKDSNRPDLWSVEGIARELRGALGIEVGLKYYAFEGSSGVEIDVDPKLKVIRPYIGCSVIKGVKIDDEVIREFMHLQDKLDQTYGKKRSRTSIGLYDFSLIEPPLHYTVAKPVKTSFFPLGYAKEMTLCEIVKHHPKGIEFGHLVKKHDYWPILKDSGDNILSFPPIINSNSLGRITETVRDILVEVTGTSHQAVLNSLIMVTLPLADRGGKIYSVKINYCYEERMMEVTPRLKTKNMRIDIEYLNRLLGLTLKVPTIIELLKRARYNVFKIEKNFITVEIPCYRIDVMHPVDIMEDVAIMYGYNNILPRWPQQVTIGSMSNEEAFSDTVREIMIGFSFQEVFSFSMSNLQNLFEKMNLEQEPSILISNPRTLRYTCIRSWLMPSILEFISHNTHFGYPQRVFEVGDCAVFDQTSDTGVKDLRKLACLIVHSNSNFSEAKSVLKSFCSNIGIHSKVESIKHSSFIEGRVGKILFDLENIGFIGEIHPKVLDEWKLGNPVSGFEIDLDKIYKKLSYS